MEISNFRSLLHPVSMPYCVHHEGMDSERMMSYCREKPDDWGRLSQSYPGCKRWGPRWRGGECEPAAQLASLPLQMRLFASFWGPAEHAGRESHVPPGTGRGGCPVLETAVGFAGRQSRLELLKSALCMKFSACNAFFSCLFHRYARVSRPFEI